MTRVTHNLALPLLILLSAALAGCYTERIRSEVGHDLVNRDALLSLSQIALVAFERDEDCPELGQDLTEAIANSLQEKRLFHVEVVRRDDPRLAMLNLEQRNAFTLKQLAQARQAIGANALLIGSINRFRSYPRMRASLDLRLLDLRTGRLIWGVDNTWDTTEKRIEDRMGEFYRHRLKPGYEPAGPRLVQMSPKMFMKFVAFEAVETLPSRAEILEQQAEERERARRAAARR